MGRKRATRGRGPGTALTGKRASFGKIGPGARLGWPGFSACRPARPGLPGRGPPLSATAGQCSTIPAIGSLWPRFHCAGNGVYARRRRWFCRSLRLHRAGRWDEAERIYRQVLEADPRHASAWKMLGALARDLGRLRESITFLEEGLYAVGADAKLYFHLGQSYQAVGDSAGAIRTYRLALTVDEAHPPAPFGPGSIAFGPGRGARGDRAFFALRRAGPRRRRGAVQPGRGPGRRRPDVGGRSGLQRIARPRAKACRRW